MTLQQTTIRSFEAGMVLSSRTVVEIRASRPLTYQVYTPDGTLIGHRSFTWTGSTMVATTHPLEDDFPVFIPQIIRTTLNEHGLPVHMSRESGSLIYGPHYETRWKHQANWELLRDTSVLHVEIQYDEEQRVIEKTTRKGHESSVLRFRYHNEGSAIRVLRSFGDDAFEHLSTRTLRNGRVASETYPRDDSRPERRFLYRYDAGALRERTFEFPSGQVLKTNVYDASYPWAQSFDALMDTWLG